MIKLYSSSSCTSCRKAKLWLEKQGLTVIERNIINEPLNEAEIQRILCLTEFGTDEIISTRSKVYAKLALDFDTLTLSELVKIMVEYPNLLRRPIITDGKKLQIGYNEEEIHQFIPREVRKLTSLELSEQLFCMDIEKKHFA
ncbi:transcriptional regulator Spx [Enterococcus hailinensis]|uniref:transcriptional regulator Spx n=1 Tax=Enterococcus hailinensis TaxID=3238988 RepID=UPI0038B38AEF